jgi:hypothetical protein
VNTDSILDKGLAENRGRTMTGLKVKCDGRVRRIGIARMEGSVRKEANIIVRRISTSNSNLEEVFRNMSL